MSHIYQLITSVQLGGAEIVAFDLAANCGKGIPPSIPITIIELYATEDDYALAKKKELASKNIRVITLCRQQKRLSLLLAPFFLLHLIKKEKPTIIHSHTDLPDLVLSAAIRMNRLFPRPFPSIVRTIHNTQLWRSHPKLGKWVEAAFNSEKIVAVSSNALVAYQDLRIKYGLPISSNKQIIYNGCSIPEESPHPFKIDKEKINIAFCGRFEDYKGMEILLPLIPEVEHRFPGKFIFHLIGDGTYKKEMKQLSERCDDVLLYDPLPGISNMLHAFDYVIIPSHFEGLGLISVEASFSGVPVIVSIAPGLDETIPDNWPLRFHLHQWEKLHDIFDNIQNHFYDIPSLRQMAYRYVADKFSKDKMILSYSLLYNELI